MTTEGSALGIEQIAVAGSAPVKITRRPSAFYHAFVEASLALAHKLHLDHSDIHEGDIPAEEAARLERWYNKAHKKGNLDAVIQGLREVSGYNSFKQQDSNDPVVMVDTFKAVRKSLIKAYAREIGLIRAYYPKDAQLYKIGLLKTAFADVKSGALSLLEVGYMDRYLKPTADAQRALREEADKRRRAERANLPTQRTAGGFRMVKVPDRETFVRLYGGY